MQDFVPGFRVCYKSANRLRAFAIPLQHFRLAPVAGHERPPAITGELEVEGWLSFGAVDVGFMGRLNFRPEVLPDGPAFDCANSPHAHAVTCGDVSVISRG